MTGTRRVATAATIVAILGWALIASGLATAEARTPLPRELRIESRRVDDDDASSRHLSRQVEIDRHARGAATWAADTLVDSRGRREYYRVGFYEGMVEALHDPTLGRGHYRKGERSGRRDVEARSTGTRTGDAAASAAARRNAERRVVEQFSNLDARPRYLPRADRPAFVPTMPPIVEPTLDEVFADFPLDAFDRNGRGREVFLEGWRYDAARLYDCRTYADFFDARWDDPGAVFRWWNERRERSAYYRTLRDVKDRRWFEERFGEFFVRRVATLFATELSPAFERGVSRGWSYGALIRQEFEYRRGFHAGYLSGMEDAARAAFHAAYPGHYEAAYRVVFDDWSHNPKLEIGEVRLSDENDDGVFAPGERVLVEAELINLGGGPARAPLRLEGRVLDRPGFRTVDLPPRSITRPEAPLEARIAGRTPNRTRVELDLVLEESVRRLPLRVSNPLQLRREAWRVRRSNLDGEVTLEVDVENESTRAVVGRLELTTASLPGRIVTRSLGTVEPGQVRRLALEVEGLDPLELLAGRVALDVALFGATSADDRFTYRVPDAARDLSNRDLLLFMVRLARERPAPGGRVATTRELLMVRLRADWKAAVARNGNPYKSDYRHDGSTTALGDLVQTYRLQDPAVRNHAVFAGLSRDVRDLAGRLPGIHPFLRKYVRRLAGELP